MTSLPGPTFWQDQFGYGSFDDFYTAVGQYIPNFSIFGIGPSQRTAALDAYQDPVSTYGNAAYIIAAYQNLTGNDPATAKQVQQSKSTAYFVAGYRTGMAQLVIPSCFQVTISAQSGGQVVDNVIGVQNSSGSATGAATAVQTAWKVASGPMSQMNTLYALTGITAVDIGSTNGAIATVTDSTAGNVSGNLSTNAACALVKWNGGTRSRSTRGRLYFGPLSEVQINADGRTLGSGTLGLINTGFTNFRNSLAGSGYPLVVLSRKTAAAFPVTSHGVESVIATQRRRIRA